jgi:hypothetical protein
MHKEAKNPTQQFERIKDHERIGYKAVMAVYRSDGNHFAIAAPNLDRLREAWNKICIEEIPLDDEMAQSVIILKDKA